jgi:hypothetical protein
MARPRVNLVHRSLVLAALLTFAAAPARAQDFTLTDEQFDMWLSNGSNSTLTLVDSQLEIEIQAIDRICRLEPDQVEKLKLAGRGDVTRFRGRVDALRKKLVGRTYDQNEMNEMWQAIQPLQQEMQAGILGDDSLFQKILHRTLQPQQVAEYEAAEAARNANHYSAKVRLYVAVLERSFPMTDEQRQALVRLFLEKTTAPRRFGQNEIYYIMYQASRLKEEDVGKLFDKDYTRALMGAFRQGAGYEHFLRQQGFIFDEMEK